MNIDFKFEIGQRVVTVLGDQGIVDYCCVTKCADAPYNSYFVKVKGGASDWYDEDQLTETGHITYVAEQPA